MIYVAKKAGFSTVKSAINGPSAGLPIGNPADAAYPTRYPVDCGIPRWSSYPLWRRFSRACHFTICDMWNITTPQPACSGRIDEKRLAKLPWQDCSSVNIRINISITELTLLDLSFENHQIEQILGLFSYDRRQWQELSFSSCSGAMERITDAVAQDKCGRLKYYGCGVTLAIAEALKRGLESPFIPLVE
jgi:hypothetical protein